LKRKRSENSCEEEDGPKLEWVHEDIDKDKLLLKFQKQFDVDLSGWKFEGKKVRLLVEQVHWLKLFVFLL